MILLSGTPTGGKYEKLWSQLHLLGWSISKKLFLNQYTVTEKIDDGSGFKRNVIVDYKNVDRLKLKLKQHGCVFMKTDEVFDLPEQVQIPVEVTNTKEFRYFMRNDLVTLSDGTELIGDTKLTKRMYARQLCGQYSKAKLSAFQDLIESTEERIIVFYNFYEELYAMYTVIGDRPRSVVNGQFKDLVAGKYGTTPVPIDPAFRKKIIGDQKPVECRPADLLEPELEKLRAEIPQWIEQEEDVLTYAQFPEVAPKFFKARRDKKIGIHPDADLKKKVHPV